MTEVREEVKHVGPDASKATSGVSAEFVEKVRNQLPPFNYEP